MAEGSAGAQPQNLGGVQVNPEFVTLYAQDGTESYWRREDLAKGEAAGLSQTKYDVDAAYAEWSANIDARVGAMRGAVEEMRRTGMVREDVWAVYNAAQGQEIEALKALTTALGAVLPHESHVAALAQHMEESGGEIKAELLPFDKRHEETARALPSERREHWRQLAAEDHTTQAKETRAALEAGLLEPPKAADYAAPGRSRAEAEQLAAAHRARTVAIAQEAGLEEVPEGWR